MRRFAALLLVMIGLCLLGFAGWMLWPAAESPPDAALVVENDGMDLGEIALFKELTITTRIRNVSRRPARILHVPPS